MIEKLMKAAQGVGDVMIEQVNAIGQSAKEKGYELIEEWLNAIPLLEACGLKVASFSLGVSISPVLELEFHGDHANFSKDAMENILFKYKSNTVVQAVFSIVKTTYRLNEKVKAPLQSPLVVRVKVKISPEIKVLIGQGFVGQQ
jgi:hypothetical protein